MKNKIIASGVILTILGMQTLPVLGYTKDETVYTKMKSNGESYQTIVNSHLKNTDNSENLIDSSILTDIENVNDDKTYSKDGDKMVWKANNEDVYYKGNTNKKLPVDCKITYKLDGNEISADDIAGKSGKVEITIDYTNKDEHQVNINGKTEKMYTPFVVMLGTIIDNKKASNITISSGKVVDNGKNTMIVGMALPGMKQNLGLKDSDTDIEIPESVTITLETTEFEMGNIYSYVTPKILEDTDVSNLDKLDELYSQMNSLQNASNQIVSGATTLNDGANTLNSKTNEFSDAVKTYTQGVNTVNENYGKIDSGIQTLDNGVSTLKNGASSINRGVNELSTGISTLNKGVTQGKAQAVKALKTSKETLISGIDQLIQGKDTETAGIKQVVEKGNESLCTGIKQSVNGSVNSVKTGMKQVLNNENLQFTEAQKAAINKVLANMDTTKIDAGIDAAVKQATTKETATIDGINNNKDGVKANMQNMKIQSSAQFDQGISAISSGFDQIAEGTTTLQNSVDTKLATGAKQLYNGTESLKQGSSTLKSGSAQIKAGVNTLSTSGEQLSQASTQLSEGTSELASGSSELKSGIEQFNRDGVSKLTNLVNNKVKDFEARLEKMQDLANEYNQFSGKDGNAHGTVKFIMMTDKVEKKENASATDSQSAVSKEVEEHTDSNNQTSTSGK